MSWMTDEADAIRARQTAREACAVRAAQHLNGEMLAQDDVANDFAPGLDDQPQDAP